MDSIQRQRRVAMAKVWFIGQVAAGCVIAMVGIAAILDFVAWIRRVL
jgi:hypothetical protein